MESPLSIATGHFSRELQNRDVCLCVYSCGTPTRGQRVENPRWTESEIEVGEVARSATTRTAYMYGDLGPLANSRILTRIYTTSQSHILYNTSTEHTHRADRSTDYRLHATPNTAHRTHRYDVILDVPVYCRYLDKKI